MGLKFCKWCIDFFLVLRALLLLSGSANIRLLFPGDDCLWYEGEREEHLLRGSSVKNHTSWLFVRVEVKAAAWDLKEREPTGQSGLRASPLLPREGSANHSPESVT